VVSPFCFSLIEPEYGSSHAVRLYETQYDPNDSVAIFSPFSEQEVSVAFFSWHFCTTLSGLAHPDILSPP
jgi:hypothetical protein